MSTETDTPDVHAALADLVTRYPEGLRPSQVSDLARQVFHVSTVRSLVPGGAVADIGGGMGIFSAGCAALGMDATLIDDFSDPANEQHGETPLDVHRSLGVKIECRDVIADGLGAAPESLDIVTSFDSMEHWHASPKALFAEVMVSLRPGGWFLLGVPNCVNLRKRVTVPLGRGKWSEMSTWYERPTFRGHVREPDVDDLQYIARDMGLVDVRLMGRNWMGYANTRAWVRRLTPLVDRPLQARPSLCSDLYLLGRKADQHTRAQG